MLDEFDNLLENKSGLRKTILSKIKAMSYQKIFVSATADETSIQMSKIMMNRPLIFKIKNEEITLEGITQYYLVTDTPMDKIERLATLLNSLTKATKGFIFCNKKETVTNLIDAMTERGIVLAYIHGKIEQWERNNIMDKLRSGQLQFLITSDLLSRGIDVQQMSMVINYDLPKDKELYIHRIGRCGRYGRKGRACTFVHQIELERLKEMEKFYNTEITEITDIGDFISSTNDDKI